MVAVILMLWRGVVLVIFLCGCATNRAEPAAVPESKGPAGDISSGDSTSESSPSQIERSYVAEARDGTQNGQFAARPEDAKGERDPSKEQDEPILVHSGDKQTERTSEGGFGAAQKMASDSERIVVARIMVDHPPPRLFVIGSEELVAEVGYLKTVVACAARVFESMQLEEDVWCLSIFSEPRFAGWKHEERIMPYVEDGTWPTAYLGEYCSKTGVLVRYPLVPSRKNRVKVRPLNDVSLRDCVQGELPTPEPFPR